MVPPVSEIAVQLIAWDEVSPEVGASADMTAPGLRACDLVPRAIALGEVALKQWP